ELAVAVRPTLQDRGQAADGWKLTGVVKSRVSLTGRSLAFTDLCGQGGPPVTRKMRATAHVPLAALEAAAPAERASARVVPVLGPAAGWAVDRVETESADTTVTPVDSLDGKPAYRIVQAITKAGDQGCQVRFMCRKPGGQLETVSVPIRWYGIILHKEATR